MVLQMMTGSDTGRLAECRDLTVVYGRGHSALQNVSVDLRTGQTVAVIGGDGAGKSTLLRALAGAVPARSGSVSIPGREHIGYQPSDSGTWRNLSVDENLRFVGRVRSIPEAEFHSRAGELLVRAGLDHARDRLARDLSGGMRQKLGFILAALHRPQLILLDEPTTGVDPVSRAELWDMVSEAASRGSTVVLATTYLDEAERCERVLLLDRGRLLTEGAPQQVIDDAPGRLAAVFPDDVEKLSSDPSTVCWVRGSRRYCWRSGGDAVPAAREQAHRLDLEGAAVSFALDAIHSQDAQGFQKLKEDFQDRSGPAPSLGRLETQTLVSVSEVTRRFGDFQALKGVTLSVNSGEVVGLLGGNGAGKTTLIRIILGLEAATTGHAKLFDGADTAESRRRTGYVSQGVGLYTGLTAGENMAFVGDVFGGDGQDGRHDLDGRLARTLVRDMSLGDQRNVAVAAATSHDPELLILDEPTSGMDRLGSVALWNKIRNHADRGAGVLITTHDMLEAEQCDRLVVLAQGTVVAEGRLEDILEGRTVFEVDSPDWQRAVDVCRERGLQVSLHGRRCRILPHDGMTVETLKSSLVRAGLTQVEITTAPATLQELMVWAHRGAPDSGEASSTPGSADHGR